MQQYIAIMQLYLAKSFNSFQMSYGKKFKEVRRAHLLSQEQFAKKLGISRSIVSQVEIDKIKPTVSALQKIASTFNISLDYLMREEKTAPAFEVLTTHSTADISESNNLVNERMVQFNRMHFEELSKRKTFQDLKDELLYQKTGIEQFIQTQAVPFISIQNREGYFRSVNLQFNNSKYPMLQLPAFSTIETRAFEIENMPDYTRKDIAVCSKHEIQKVVINEHMVLISANNFYAGITEEINAETITINNTVLLISTIREAWKVELYISAVPKNTPMQQQLNRMENLLEQVARKKKKHKKK